MCGNFCYWYHVAQYYLLQLGRCSLLSEEEGSSGCCLVLKTRLACSQIKTKRARWSLLLLALSNMFLKRLSFGNKECTEELKLDLDLTLEMISELLEELADWNRHTFLWMMHVTERLGVTHHLRIAAYPWLCYLRPMQDFSFFFDRKC